jgi:hypothetical protein
MKKLKSIARDHGKKWLNHHTEDGYFDLDSFEYEEGFLQGFKEAFKFIQTQLTEEREKLEPFPIMTERRMAMAKMQEKLNRLFEEVIDETDKK